MIKQSSCLAVLVLLLNISTFAQGTIDKYGNFHPSEDAIAKNKRMGELLQHPTFISLRLLSQKRDGLKEEPSTTPSPYTVGQRIHFELFLTQNSSEDIMLTSSWWPYNEYRPELLRDGDVLPYSKRAQTEIEKGETESRSGSMTPSTITPGHEILSNYVQLEDWYESPLPVGHYELVVRKRFTLNGDWIESNSVTFDVIAQKSSDTQSPSGQSLLKLILNDAKEEYKFGEPIRFQQKIENQSDGQAGIEGFDFYYQNRPKLLLDSKVVPYKSKTDSLIRSKESDPGGLFISLRIVRIEPHSTRDLGELDLADWYDALQPGSYQLTNKYRTSFDGPWTKESAEIKFRIEPKN